MQPQTSSDPSPFHVGEQQVQSRLGVRESIEPWARRVVLPHLPEQHRSFYASLPYLVVAARDAAERPWVTILADAPGFASAPEPDALVIRARPVPGDALEQGLAPGSDVGILGIELATRRRNRVNGRVAARDAQGLTLAVEQSFGNCPQYIRERAWTSVPAPETPVRERHTRLTSALSRRIRASDTFFIASGFRGEGEDPRFGMDASHRGGEPGFVRVLDERTLLIPDYAGNNHFNTVGNLVVDPRAGLLFVDFESGGMLQLTGRVEIDWDSPEVAEIPGARRLLRFVLEEAIELRSALPLRWDAEAASVRTLRLVEKRRESEDVVSFVFEARDGGPLADFEAGQHLPIELAPADGERLRRTYSLSNGPGGGRYRISVKREPLGAASRHLHDEVEPGAFVNARVPAGEFVLDHGDRPLVLVSAGIGVTPMLSMLHAQVERGDGRPVWFVHGARDGRHHALSEEVHTLVGASDAARLHVVYSRPGDVDRQGVDYDSEGRVDGALLASLHPGLDAEFYLCGPLVFMAGVQADLERRGVPAERIHSESFGPVG